MSLAYELIGDKENVIIRLPKESIDQKAVEKLLDYLELESIRRRSELTTKDAEQLASEVKGSAWHQVKGLFNN